MSIKIAPSILSADFSILAEEVKRVEEGGADLLHVDVMDGHFVPNITIGPLVVSSLKGKTKLPFDVHLMIENPDNYIDAFIQAGAEMITIHVEAAVHLHRTLQNIREKGVKVGVALNPATPLDAIEYILDQVDMVLLMTVNPGFGGQAFIKAVLPKINRLRTMIEQRGLTIDIQVDGGINKETAPLAIKAGANILVAGSAVYGSSNIGETISALRSR